MSLAFGIAVYFVIWWTLLFAILPFGVRSQREANSIVPGTDPGAPVFHHLGRKLLVNTAMSAILWGIADWVYVVYYLEPLANGGR